MALLKSKASERVYKAIVSIVSSQNFNFNEDLSKSERSYQNRDFTVHLVSAKRNDSYSNRQNIRLDAEFLINIYYLAHTQTQETYLDVLNNLDSLIHALERFETQSEYADVPQTLVSTNRVSEIKTETVGSGNDVMLKVEITLEVTYKIPNPN